MQVYKVVAVIHGVRVSLMADMIKEFRTVYPTGEKVHPSVKGSQLFVVGTREQAESLAENHLSHQTEIWECEIPDEEAYIRDDDEILIPRPSYIGHFWERVFGQDTYLGPETDDEGRDWWITPNYASLRAMSAPDGTILTPWLILTKRVAEYDHGTLTEYEDRGNCRFPVEFVDPS